jgi:hypothetical protein
VTDSTTLRAHQAPVAAVDGTQIEIATAVREVLEESARAGVDLPEGFAERVARAVSTRSRRPLLALGWAMYRAGVDRAVADSAHEEPTARRPVTQAFERPKP